MKLALLGLCVLPLAALRPAPQAELPFDEPIECPMCGGNVALHNQVMVLLASTQATVGHWALASGWN